MTKGALHQIVFRSSDVDGDFEKVQASGAEVLQEPMDQGWGARDCAFRGPFRQHRAVVPAALSGAVESCGWAMLTIQAMPNRSVHMPNSSPHICFSSGIVTVPPSDSLLPVAAQLVGVVAAQADRDVVAGRCAPCPAGCRRPSA